MCAWTAPKTFTVGSVLTAAELNTHVRDNLNYIKGNVGTVAFADIIKYSLNRQGSSTLTTSWETGGTYNQVDSDTYLQAGCITMAITSAEQWHSTTVTLPVALTFGPGISYASLVVNAANWIPTARVAYGSSTIIVSLTQKDVSSGNWLAGSDVYVNWLVIGK